MLLVYAEPFACNIQQKIKPETTMNHYLITLICLLTLTACKPETVQLVVNIGAEPSLESAVDCENRVDWFDNQAADDTYCTLAFAATELTQHLQLITADGRWLETTSQPGTSPQPRILIASQDLPESYSGFAIPESLLQQKLEKQSYWIKSYQQDGYPQLVIMGGDRTGALYGVYALLEHLGVRWYGPGDTGRVLPELQTLELENIDIKHTPGFITRGFWARDDRGHADFFDWMARNRINLWSYGQPEKAALKKRGIGFLTGGHQIQQRFLNAHEAFPYQLNEQPFPHSHEFAGDRNGDGVISYSEAHPEWYGIKNGQRDFDMSYKYGTNFCSSNPSAVRELSKNFIHDLIQGQWSKADMINFWMSDVGHWCECENCQALGTPTDRMLLLLHQVRGEMNSAQQQGYLQRDIILTAPAYLETRRAPQQSLPDNFDYQHNIMTFFPIERCYSHAFNDASCTDINHHHNQDLLSWMDGEHRYYKGTMFFGEYYNISLLASLPIIFTRVMSRDLPYYHQLGLRHMHYMHAETHNWGTMLLTNYLFAKMLWNPRLDVEASLGELYVRYYGGQVADDMQLFYKHLELALSSMKTIRWAGKSFSESYSLDDRLKKDKPDLFITPHLQYNATENKTNDGRDIVQMVNDIRLARSYLDKAREKSSGEPYEGRLESVEQRFAYGEAMVFFYDYLIQTHQAHHAGKLQQAKRAFRELRKYAEKLQTMTDIIKVVGGTLKAGDGMTATFNKETYERYLKLYGPQPVTLP